MDKHTRYNTSEKGKLRSKLYYTTEKGHLNRTRYNYARYKKRLSLRIPIKRQKIAVLERILKYV